MAAISVRQSLVSFLVSRSFDHTLLPENIRLAVVFGEQGENAIIVTGSDEVFSFGSNGSQGVLGVGDGKQRTEPAKVEQLNAKQVCYIAVGWSHVLALTAGGDVYAWGYNGYYQLGNVDTTNILSPQLCCGLQGKRIKQITCGSNHCLALTDTHEVFGWGNNSYGQIGTGDTAHATSPVLVRSLSSSPPVKVIRCGCHSSFALTSSGEIFGWGANEYGQLGIGTKNHELRPRRVGGQLSVKFKDIACGGGFSLAVSDEGDLYAWGIVWESRSSVDIPVIEQIALDHMKVVDIGGAIHSRLSAALTSCGKTVVLGKCRGSDITKVPRITAFKSLPDAFVWLSQPPVTWTPLTLTSLNSWHGGLTVEMGRARLCDNLQQQFDNEEVSDVKFVVDGKTLHGHISFLRMQSAYLRTLLGSRWAEGKREIEVRGHTYAAFRAYLRFLYTGRLEVGKEDVFDLLRLADEYLEKDLVRYCADLVISAVSKENAFEVYCTAKRLGLKTLQTFCANFILSNLPGIVATEAYGGLDSQIVKDFFHEVFSLTE